MKLRKVMTTVRGSPTILIITLYFLVDKET